MKVLSFPKNRIGRTVILTLIVLVVTAIWFYITIPAVNLKNPGFVFCVLLLALIIWGIWRLFNRKPAQHRRETVQTPFGPQQMWSPDFKNSKTGRIVLVLVGIYFAYLILGSLFGATIFRAQAYASQMPLTELQVADFAKQISPQSIGSSTLPIIDKDIALRRAEGQLGTYGAQYSMSQSFTMIHIKKDGVEQLVRVSPLEYSGFFVALNRYNQGSVGYIMVNVVTEKAELVLVPEGIKYLENGLLNRNLARHIWLHHPTALVTDYSFEIDDEGHPFWVATVYDNQIGLFSGQTPVGAILVDAVSGETARYDMDKVPKWVDRVVPTEQAITQATNALTYKNGWFNATFGAKENVFNLTDEYNYLTLNGKTYLYSGVTSPNAADETSVGFVLIDLKTKDARYYRVQGITELRAMDIARAHQKVKAQNLSPTVPILINIEGEPTYFLILKNALQRQWYVLVRVSDGAVVLNENLKNAKTEYISLLSNNLSPDSQLLKETRGVVLRVRATQNDMFEFVLQGDVDFVYAAPLSLGVDTRFLTAGDEITIKFIESGDGTYLVRELVNHTLHTPKS